MEKVTDLFKAFRNNEIAYDELFGSLTRMLSEDPHFATQAISALDNAQQLTPIPVTDFIQLRGQLENTAETFLQQETDAGPAATEATTVFPAEEQTQRPDPGMAGAYDPTLVTNVSEAAPASSSEPQAAEPDPDYHDEATVIMPMPPRQQTPEPAATPPSDAIPAPAATGDDQATLIATEATAGPRHTPPAEPAPEPPAPAARPTQKDKAVPVLLLAGIAAVSFAVILTVVLWPASDPQPAMTSTPETSAPDPWQSSSPVDNDSQQREPEMSESAGTPPTEEAVFSESAFPEEETETSQPAMDTPANEIFASDTDAPLEPETPETTDSMAMDTPVAELPQEPVVKDETYFMAQIKAALAEDRLNPAEEEGTATYFLVELIRYDSESDSISEARTLISKRHLELAKEAREQSQWDAAQQHLDDALKVRLPDSYLP